jgi:ubiquinone/menaquinone biosynthesis C-methylase UbiE
MLEQAGSSKRDQGGINYIAGDVLALPFPDKQFQLITALGVMSHILPQGFPRFVGEIDRVATESAVVVIAQTPLPWRLFFARRSAFQPTLLDKALAALYNLLQTTMGLDERRGVYTPEVVSNEFSKHHFSVEFHIVQNLSVMIACR